MSQDTPTRVDVRLISAIVLCVIGLVGVLSLLRSPAHQVHDPVHGLQQLDLLYLDQPAPLPDRIRPDGPGPTLLVICEGCRAPKVDAQTIVTDDPEVAEAYELRRADGGIGPGYALIDADGVLRYRTFDPNAADHAEEIAILLDGLP